MEAPHVAIDDEAAFGRTVWRAIWVSAPIVFIGTTLICVPGAGSLKIAALIALLPTFFTVPFVGGLVGLSITQFRQDARRKLAVELARLNATTELNRAA